MSKIDKVIEIEQEQVDDVVEELLNRDRNPKQVKIGKLTFTVKPLLGSTYATIQRKSLVEERNGRNVSRSINFAKYNPAIIIEGCVSPNFRSVELMERAGVATKDPVDLVDKLLSAGEQSLLVEQILKVSGFEEAEEEIKND